MWNSCNQPGQWESFIVKCSTRRRPHLTNPSYAPVARSARQPVAFKPNVFVWTGFCYIFTATPGSHRRRLTRPSSLYVCRMCPRLPGIQTADSAASLWRTTAWNGFQFVMRRQWPRRLGSAWRGDVSIAFDAVGKVSALTYPGLYYFFEGVRGIVVKSLLIDIEIDDREWPSMVILR